MATLPIVILLFSFLSWVVIYKFKKSIDIIRGRTISTFIIVLFLVHPDVVMYMLSVFNCYNVDGDRRIYDNLQVICEGGTYKMFALGIGVPGILIWGIGIPLFIIILLSAGKS
mmetsp:Transcript_45629/g.33369  ORF Transcript_45629/g.33369 Transcript_45629/m.33369 type:complete len:113 (-) Transcript_45629:933-1271(-)